MVDYTNRGGWGRWLSNTGREMGPPFAPLCKANELRGSMYTRISVRLGVVEGQEPPSTKLPKETNPSQH